VPEDRKKIPLAYRVRPSSFRDFIGQKKLISENSLLISALRSRNIPSLILYGPPGCGKTTLAHLIAEEIGSDFYQLSAVDSGVKDVRNLIKKGEENLKQGKKTVLFIDEIHRFNKAQQDALLPAVENGSIILIGATTENPFFEIIGPLLSRCLLIVLEPLSEDELKEVIIRAARHPQGLNGIYEIDDEAVEAIIRSANGDARRALNILESASNLADQHGRSIITPDDVEKVIQTAVFYYDKSGNYHYDYSSAFIKSLRASDPDAALAYMVRMIKSGEDPRFIARRMMIFASEDIGNADPLAILIASTAFDAVERVGMPECIINLAQAVTYLATCPKSNASYVAVTQAMDDAEKIPVISIPAKLRDAHYKGAEFFGHGTGYRYPHSFPGHFYPESLMPDELKGKIYYKPTEIGYEKKIKERLDYWRRQILEKGK
jgi:putative ATPase